MVVVAGDSQPAPDHPSLVLDGARYNPATDAWTALENNLPAPPIDTDRFAGYFANQRVVVNAGNSQWGFNQGTWALQPAFHLDPGVYTETVLIDDPAALNGPQTLTVTLTVSGRPMVTDLDPQFGSDIASLSAIQVAFNLPMDAATLTNTTVILTAAGGDSDFTSGNETVVTPTALNLTDPTHLTIDLSSTSLPPDLYRITLKGSVQSVYGIALDGEFSGAMPSGDGNAGGDFVSIFSITP